MLWKVFTEWQELKGGFEFCMGETGMSEVNFEDEYDFGSWTGAFRLESLCGSTERKRLHIKEGCAEELEGVSSG